MLTVLMIQKHMQSYVHVKLVIQTRVLVQLLSVKVSIASEV